MDWERQIFCHIGPFLLFYLLMTPNIKILKKWKNCREILSFYTYMCTINEDHMIYGFEMQDATDIFFVILGHFLPFYPLSTWTIEILKKWKNSERYYHFTNVYQKWQSFDGWILRYHGIIGVHSPPLNLGPPLITKLQVPLTLSGRTFSYFRPLYQYLYRTL